MIKKSSSDNGPKTILLAAEFVKKNGEMVMGGKGGAFIKEFEVRVRSRYDKDIQEAGKLFGENGADWEIFCRRREKWLPWITILRDSVRRIDSGIPYDRYETLWAMAELDADLEGFEHTLVENQPSSLV